MFDFYNSSFQVLFSFGRNHPQQIVAKAAPTAGMTVAGLAVCKISFPQWWKTCWKFMIVVVVVGLVFTAISGMLPA